MPNNPCETSSDNNFGHCVERSLIRMAGCQPPWSRVKVEDMPLCDNKTLVLNYSTLYFEVSSLERENLCNLTKCLMPCSYMEYKVRGKS